MHVEVFNCHFSICSLFSQVFLLYFLFSLVWKFLLGKSKSHEFRGFTKVLYLLNKCFHSLIRFFTFRHFHHIMNLCWDIKQNNTHTQKRRNDDDMKNYYWTTTQKIIYHPLEIQFSFLSTQSEMLFKRVEEKLWCFQYRKFIFANIVVVVVVVVVVVSSLPLVTLNSIFTIKLICTTKIIIR